MSLNSMPPCSRCYFGIETAYGTVLGPGGSSKSIAFAEALTGLWSGGLARE